MTALPTKSDILEDRDNKQTRIFVGQVDGGVGLNELKVASVAIYFSNSRKVLSRRQSEGRIRRRGSEIFKEITYYDLLTEDTIDVHILKSIKKSVSLADYILAEIRKGKNVSNLVS